MPIPDLKSEIVGFLDGLQLDFVSDCHAEKYCKHGQKQPAGFREDYRPARR
jgi:hypothetical protein